MKITNIHQDWGSTIELENSMDFFSADKNFWRDLIYKRKLLVFKKMSFGVLDYMKFAHFFGSPWTREDYAYSLEHAVTLEEKGRTYCTTAFSNRIISQQRIPNEEMVWHADIPNRSFRPFPHRSLWITKNPNPEVSGKTKWLNINLAQCDRYLTDQMRSYFDVTKIQQQSWYYPGTDLQMHDFIKVHPITGERSLRLNTYNDPAKNVRGAWITGVYINDVRQPDCRLVENFIHHLLKFEDLTYTHQWDLYDIAIYDNYAFIHGRTALVLGQNSGNNERKFFRSNIDHVSDTDWANQNI